MRIKDFRPTASPEQLRVLDRIIKLGEQERIFVNRFQEQQNKIEETFSSAESFWGFQREMVFAECDLLLEDVEPVVQKRDMYLNRIKIIQTEIKTLFKRAKEELGMGNLGYIQRNYDAVMNAHTYCD